MRLIIFTFIIACCFGCINSSSEELDQIPEQENPRNLDFAPCDSYFKEIGYIYTEADQDYLWGGLDSSWHFNITDWQINDCNLKYGLGREAFPALIEPVYRPISDAKEDYGDFENCIVVFGTRETKVYPYEDLEIYEAINEVIDNEPIMIAYCVLANLGAVYTRRLCNDVLTFGVSGYTYFEPEIWDGLDGFVLWDRETESLWWPLIDQAISGPLEGLYLEKHQTGNWEVMNWKDIVNEYPDALVIKKQTQSIPQEVYLKNLTFDDCF